MPIDADRVNEIFLDCLFQDGEDHTHHVAVHGITVNVGLHPGRLEGHREEIIGLLDQLPNSFKAEGGESFILACYDKDDQQWTGLHERMEQLFILGMAIGRVEYAVARQSWVFLPGGLPTMVIKDK